MENKTDSKGHIFRKIEINGGFIRLTYIPNGWDNSPSIRVQIEENSGHLRQGPEIPEGEIYHSVEGSKGELGFYLVGDGSENPYRMKVRSPCFIMVSALEKMMKGHMIADAISVIGSIDIVLGEIDR